jgi:hypothetical protein
LQFSDDDGIVVVGGRAAAWIKGYPDGSTIVPLVLAARLGEPAATALVEFSEANNRACMEFVISQCTERFERRLAEEGAALRVEMAHLETGLRGDMAAMRAELLKWAFLFWVGQLASVAAIVGLLRT